MSERVLTRRWQVAIRLPVGACLAVAIALWHRRRHAAAWSGPVAWAAVGVLAIESILAITSLGAFLLPAVVLVLFDSEHFSLLAALIVAAVAVIVFRGLVEVITRKLIPSPSLYGADQSLKETDIVARRRYWLWRGKISPAADLRGRRAGAAGPVPGAVLILGRHLVVL